MSIFRHLETLKYAGLAFVGMSLFILVAFVLIDLFDSPPQASELQQVTGTLNASPRYVRPPRGRSRIEMEFRSGLTLAIQNVGYLPIKTKIDALQRLPVGAQLTILRHPDGFDVWEVSHAGEHIVSLSEGTQAHQNAAIHRYKVLAYVMSLGVIAYAIGLAGKLVESRLRRTGR